MRVSEDILGPLIIYFAVIGILATLSHIHKALVNLNQAIKRNFRTNRAQTIQHRQHRAHIVIIHIILEEYNQ